MKNKIIAAVCSMLLYLTGGGNASATDISGVVDQLQIAPDGRLWFSIGQNADSYCKPGWANLNIFVPADHPQHTYYYAMLMASLVKGKRIYLANLSKYNGTTACDITTTGFGIILLSY